MSSADGSLDEWKSDGKRPGLCRKKTAARAGEGRAYTQNPTTAQASGRGAGPERKAAPCQTPEGVNPNAIRALTAPFPSCTGFLP